MMMNKRLEKRRIGRKALRSSYWRNGMIAVSPSQSSTELWTNFEIS